MILNRKMQNYAEVKLEDGRNEMYTKMLTSKMGGELVSFTLNGQERIHQGIDTVDENGKVYWKRHAPVLFPVVGKLKKNQTIINRKNL